MYTAMDQQESFAGSYIADLIMPKHPLIRLRDELDWSAISRIYEECFPSDRGNATIPTNIAIGLLIYKHLSQRSDRQVVQDLHENIYVMYFCALRPETIKKEKAVLCHSTLVKIRKRLGSDRILRIEKLFMRQQIAKKLVKSQILITDCTSLQKNIAHPIDLSLLIRVIEAARMVARGVGLKKGILKDKVVRTARRVAKTYFAASRKDSALLKRSIQKLLAIAGRQQKNARNAFNRFGKKEKKRFLEIYSRLNTIGSIVIEQTGRRLNEEKIKDRIVSYHEDHSRPLPKGKITGCEFGVKLRVDMTGDGWVVNHRVYRGNPADCGMLADVLAGIDKNGLEELIQELQADRGFANDIDERILAAKHKICCLIPARQGPDGFTKQQRERYKRRAAIEAKISEGKRMTGLRKSLYRGFEGDEIWAGLGVMALNIRKWMRVTTPKVA